MMMQTDQAGHSLEVLHRLSLAIAKATDMAEVYEQILDEVVVLLGVEKASIMIYDPGIEALKIVAARGMPKDILERAVVRVGEGISGRVFAQHEPLLIEDIRVAPLGPNRDRYRTNSLMSAPVTCFPMKVGEATLGVINVTDPKDGRKFTADDLKLLMTITNQAASYLHLCQLSEKIKAGERLREQLEIARQIQFKLIPSITQSIEGLDVAAQVITAERVGGDYYDCFYARAKKPSFIIADVSGHSIGAAMMMAGFRAAVRSQQDSDFAPATLATRVNEILYEDLYQAEQFISMVYLQYMRSRQLVQLTSAGHPPVLFWRGIEKVFDHLVSGDPLLGIEAYVRFHERKVVVSPGDALILYTDGIPEAMNSEGERFGIERMMETLASTVGKSSQEIVDSLLGRVVDFSAGTPLRDDLTLLVLKVV